MKNNLVDLEVVHEGAFTDICQDRFKRFKDYLNIPSLPQTSFDLLLIIQSHRTCPIRFVSLVEFELVRSVIMPIKVRSFLLGAGRPM